MHNRKSTSLNLAAQHRQRSFTESNSPQANMANIQGREMGTCGRLISRAGNCAPLEHDLIYRGVASFLQGPLLKEIKVSLTCLSIKRIQPNDKVMSEEKTNSILQLDLLRVVTFPEFFPNHRIR